MPPPESPTEPPSVVRRPGGRAARVRKAILSATITELTAGGYGALNAARIAERAGVHRSTVHRRWPDLDQLVTEALIDAATAAIPMPDNGDITADLTALLHSIVDYIGGPQTRVQIRALVADAARSPAIAEVVSHVWTTRFRVGEEVIIRAVDRGELRDDIPATTVLAVFTGPIYVRLLLTGEPLDAEFIDAVVELGLAGARRP
ncbi:MAG: TetR/AcrR family transcriptional regulator [Nocardioides sp.]|uniref:TetR/AcrR family transcriptional regulator n=1 Tax=Nocardioides sp. TaxID=35761 RepID=UPI0039E2E662